MSKVGELFPIECFIFRVFSFLPFVAPCGCHFPFVFYLFLNVFFLVVFILLFLSLVGDRRDKVRVLVDPDCVLSGVSESVPCVAFAFNVFKVSYGLEKSRQFLPLSMLLVLISFVVIG